MVAPIETDESTSSRVFAVAHHPCAAQLLRTTPTGRMHSPTTSFARRLSVRTLWSRTRARDRVCVRVRVRVCVRVSRMRNARGVLRRPKFVVRRRRARRVTSSERSTDRSRNVPLIAEGTRDEFMTQHVR